MNEATLSKEQVGLLAMVVSHIGVVGHEECRFYLRTENRSQIPEALKRGFVLPGAIPMSAVPVEMASYPIEETDCFAWLGHMEKFAEERFGVEVVLRDKFPIPPRLPWKNVLPIFDPGNLTNRMMVDKVLKARKIAVYESTDVMESYSGSGAFSVPRLYLIERSPWPTIGTMGLPPKFAKQWFSGRQTTPLNFRGYGIGTSLWYEVEKKFLDPEFKTVTWFPEDILLSGDCVACGYYDSADGEVKFHCFGAGNGFDCYGFREAILLFQS